MNNNVLISCAKTLFGHKFGNVGECGSILNVLRIIVHSFTSLLSLALLILIAVILVNTFNVQSKQPHVKILTATTPPDSALSHFQQAIRYKTISVSDTLSADTAVFIAFQAFLHKA